MSTRAYARSRDDFLDMAYRIVAASIPCSIDDMIDLGNILLTIFQTHNIVFTFPTQPARSYYLTLSDPTHETHFLDGGSIDLALSTYPHLNPKALGQNSWSRSVDVLNEGAGVRKFSYLSCIGIMEYSIRAQDTIAQAESNGELPEFVWILGHQTKDPLDRPRVPVYMSPYVATTFVPGFSSLSAKDKATTFHRKPTLGHIAQQLDHSIAYSSSHAHRRQIKVTLYLSDAVPNAKPLSYIRNAFCDLRPTEAKPIAPYDPTVHVFDMTGMLHDLKVAVSLIESTSTRVDVNSQGVSKRTTKKKKATEGKQAWDNRGVKRQQDIEAGPSKPKTAKIDHLQVQNLRSRSRSSQVSTSSASPSGSTKLKSSEKRPNTMDTERGGDA